MELESCLKILEVRIFSFTVNTPVYVGLGFQAFCKTGIFLIKRKSTLVNVYNSRNNQVID